MGDRDSVVYLSSAKLGDSNDWKRALVLAVAIPLIGLLPVYIGAIFKLE
jgi:hypothetical protein